MQSEDTPNRHIRLMEEERVEPAEGTADEATDQRRPETKQHYRAPFAPGRRSSGLGPGITQKRAKMIIPIKGPKGV